jgi:hypothetical protein
MAILGLIVVMFGDGVEQLRRTMLDNKEAPGAVRFGRYELEDEKRHELPGLTAAHELEQN